MCEHRLALIYNIVLVTFRFFKFTNREPVAHCWCCSCDRMGHNGVIPKKSKLPKRLEHDLQELIMKLRRRDECETSLVGNDEEDWFDETMTCAGYLGREVGLCTGDSGGPLVKYAKRGTSRRWTVIGVTSWGSGCALQNELDFFANVPHFVPWINENINPEAARLRRNT
ncbi:complement factor B-2 [Apostichopus japonicus]|uniref:Complement factor B-2 n=1 Tax=Stichopus japonicus TaxID=307972 RepID=A0A2G8JXK4_STIJA|nr:complement factor B-2 [Apostichopus japonicus]